MRERDSQPEIPASLPAVQGDVGRLWISLVEQAARSERLERELSLLRSSVSWRVTAPLRRLRALLSPAGAEADDRRAESNGEAGCGKRADRRSDGKSPASDAWLPAVFPGLAQGEARWLVDVTELAREDLGAGVQRVTRRLLLELLLSPPAGHRIEPVRLEQGAYRRAARFLSTFVGAESGAFGEDDPVEPRSGDVFIGLDLCRDQAASLAAALARFRAAAVPVCLLVHDVLPLTRPDWFPAPVVAAFPAWLGVLSKDADLAICNSRCTAAELGLALASLGLEKPTHGIQPIPLGADLLPVPEAETAVPSAASGIRVLTVSTIEPRKGHAQMLDAFERLWSQGEPFVWTIAGRAGWNVDPLVRRLRMHAEAGRRLHWIEGPDDRSLAALYRRSDVLLMASRGEGFGLPVAEAGRLGLALVLRDLPVFREVAGESAEYFHGESAEDVAQALVRWRGEPIPGRGAPSHRWPTWADSADALKACVERVLPFYGKGQFALGNSHE